MDPQPTVDLTLAGRVSGNGSLPASDFCETVDYDPVSEVLGITLTRESARRREVIAAFAPVRAGGDEGEPTCFPALISVPGERGELRGHAVIADGDDPETLGLLAPVDLRVGLRLTEGDSVIVEFTEVSR